MLTRREMVASLWWGAGAVALAAGAESSAPVMLQRVPDHGIQPQVAVDRKGVIHLIYFRGDPAGGNISYARSADGGGTFSPPLPVNHQAGSAVAIGNVRGAHLAVGQSGRVHVAWMGSGKARPRGPQQTTPMLYTRLNDSGTAFEPERNMLQAAAGLDGGASIAADSRGHVYVAWHAPAPGTKGEENRRVWVARSADDGQTFTREEPVSAAATGVCGCCGMRAFADHEGAIYMLYRSATAGVHRDMYLLRSVREGTGFQGDKLHEWLTGTCPMSTAALAESVAGVLAAWETDGQVYYLRMDRAAGRLSAPVAAPGAGRRRKHPVVAGNARGEAILAWTEGMGWNRGGSVAWQVFDKDGKPTAGKGHAEGVPTWSLVAVYPRPDGRFVVLY
jgi:hypothetical protein